MRLIDVVLPARCLVCGSLFEPAERVASAGNSLPVICAECTTACMTIDTERRCPVCSIPLPRFISVCERCRRTEYAFDRAIALHPNEGVPAALIRAYKFGRHRSLAPLIAAAMVPVVAPLVASGAVLVPVPSRRATVRARGFSGAYLIAVSLTSCLALRPVPDRSARPTLADVLRSRARRVQKELDSAARRENARRSIVATAPAGSNVVLIDDVMTTGATADACASALRATGTSGVTVVVFAMEY